MIHYKTINDSDDLYFRMIINTDKTDWNSSVTGSKVDPAKSHNAGIRKGDSGATFATGRQALGMHRANVQHERFRIGEFNRRLILQLLNEMAMPVQS